MAHLAWSWYISRPERRDFAVHRSNNLFSELTAQWTDQDKVAIETSAGKEYRYSDLLGITSRFAHALKATGVQPGDRVAVQVEKSPEALFLYLACLRAGAAYLPLNTAYTEAELDYFLRELGAVCFCLPPKPRWKLRCAMRADRRSKPFIARHGSRRDPDRACGRTAGPVRGCAALIR